VSDEHPNATRYRRTADAFRARDFDTLATLVDKAVVWHIPGSSAFAGDVRGAQALIDWLSGVAAIGFWVREHDVFGNDEHVCALSYMGARRPGVDVETQVVSIFHYRDGRQLERWFYPADLATWDVMLGGPADDAT
jgi:ketosteroid isomerase-like protein